MLYQTRITQNDAKQHLHDIRSQRQKQLALIINECHQLRIKHKRIFDCQLKSYLTQPCFLIKDEFIIPHIPLEDNLSDIDELTEYSSESLSIFPDNQISNNRKILPRKISEQRCSSVSSVASVDKRANKVYEKWPDYSEISQLLGYRIVKTPSTPNPTPPIIEMNPKKRKKSARSGNSAKQIGNTSLMQQDELKTKSIDELSVIQKEPISIPIIKETKPKLPSYLCPSSKNYSKRIQTRQWLIKNYFSSQTLPLI